MKTRVIIFASVVLMSFDATGQEWIGNRFTLDTIVALGGSRIPDNPRLTKCVMHNKTFYFVEQQGFQDKDNGYNAIVHALSTDDYSQTEIMLPLPECGRNRDRYAQSLWIYDLSFDDDRLLVTTQDELILYKRIDNQNYQVENRYHHHNLFMGYLHQNSIHFFEEDHDKGFKWFQQDLSGDSATLVRELPYEAPHIVQIQPNRYISHNQQSVFFLSTRFPRLEVYALDGQALDTVLFDLSPWKPFEDDYIRKTMSVPYGIERIYAVKDDIYAYSYPKVAIPLCGDLVLLYTQFDTLSGKSSLQYAIRSKDGATIPYLLNNREEIAYTAGRFPFTLFQGGLDKGNASDLNTIVQITYETGVSWQEKTHSEYQKDVNRYFEKQEPALAYKVMRYVPENSNKPTMFTMGGVKIALNEMPYEKSVILLHQELECSGCVKALYQLFNQSSVNGIHIGHIFPHAISGIQSFELNSQIKRQLQHPFTLYYDTSSNYENITHPLKLQHSDFPCLLLLSKGEEPQLFRAGELFTDNYMMTEFNEIFRKAWQSFIPNPDDFPD